MDHCSVTELDELLALWNSGLLTGEKLSRLAELLQNLDAEGVDSERISASVQIALDLEHAAAEIDEMLQGLEGTKCTHQTMLIFLGPGDNNYGRDDEPFEDWEDM